MTAVATAFDVVLGAGVLAVAVLTLFVPRRSTAVVLFLVLGVLLAVVWARLAAPDVALAEAAVGAGVTGALLLRAVAARPGADREDGPRPPWAVPLLGGLSTAAVAVLLGMLVLSVGTPDADLGPAVRESTGATGVSHPVTAVLLGFRAYDTLLEVAVLAAALLGALALQPDDAQRDEGRPDGDLPGLTSHPVPEPLGVLTHVLSPVLVLAAGWVLVAGSTRPGGAFQAGALVAGALLLLHLGGRPGAVPTGGRLRRWALAGLGAFLALAGGTAASGRGWLRPDPAWAGGAVLALETVLAAGIGVTLAAIFVATARSAPARVAARGADGPTRHDAEEADG